MIPLPTCRTRTSSTSTFLKNLCHDQCAAALTYLPSLSGFATAGLKRRRWGKVSTWHPLVKYTCSLSCYTLKTHQEPPHIVTRAFLPFTPIGFGHLYSDKPYLTENKDPKQVAVNLRKAIWKDLGVQLLYKIGQINFLLRPSHLLSPRLTWRTSSLKQTNVSPFSFADISTGNFLPTEFTTVIGKKKRLEACFWREEQTDGV